ncbi:hypothetical protein LR48_Vigan01g090500 [Vigna angularis]|uniref:CCHC-type domain-containing protein n=1 Tax=Phaseolus angularis TaxID=3914 RepID=A0A0L9TLC5_PHAAN|nr:hypothetical protein LR48_Vigan01g090500 [Vigna angularis]
MERWTKPATSTNPDSVFIFFFLVVRTRKRTAAKAMAMPSRANQGRRVLGSQKSVLNKQGIGYKGKSNKTNARKFTDLSKPSSISCFYCNSIGHLSKPCYYKKAGKVAHRRTTISRLGATAERQYGSATTVSRLGTIAERQSGSATTVSRLGATVERQLGFESIVSRLDATAERHLSVAATVERHNEGNDTWSYHLLLLDTIRYTCRSVNNGWVFKDENQNEEDVPAPYNVGSSSAAFRPKIEFEKFMVRQMHSLSTLCQSRFGKIDKGIVVIQEKLGIQSLNDDDQDEENDEDEEEAMEDDDEGDDGDNKEEESEEEESDDNKLLRDMI